MNAATRFPPSVSSQALPRQWVLTLAMSKKQALLGFLSLTLLFSAFAIVYVTHATREWYTQYQQALIESDQLKMLRNQLLLEHSTLLTPGHIEKIATDKLNMVTPADNAVVVIHE